MTTGAYYNEIDPQKAAWLRELINRGLIASGDVDERSIRVQRPQINHLLIRKHTKHFLCLSR